MQQEIVSLLTSLYWDIWGKGHIKFGFIWTSWYLKITVTISWDPREYGGKSDIHVVYMCYAYCICVIYMHIYVYIHTYTSDIHVDRKKSLLLKILLFDKFNSSDCCAKTFAGGLPTVSPRLLLWFSVIQSHKWSLYYTSISIPWSPCPQWFCCPLYIRHVVITITVIHT